MNSPVNFGSTTLLLTQTLFVGSQSSDRYLSYFFFIDKNLWSKFFFYSLLNVGVRCGVVDGIQFDSASSHWSVQFNLTSFSTDRRFSCITLLTRSGFYLTTTAWSYKSSIWLERELSDFTGLNFKGLVDTRRLLLDYFEEKHVWQSHISNDKNYNNLFYDITLSF